MKKVIVAILILTVLLRFWSLQKPDVTTDELHYISDSYRLANKDPYIAVRYHSLRHPKPSIGHPFLTQIIGASVFNILGFSITTARLPSVIGGILMVFALFFFDKKFGGKFGVLAAFLLAINPFAVRFSRDAHLDSIFSLFVTLVVLSIWRYHNNEKKYWLIVAGVCTGLAISTKLYGVIALVLAFVLIIAREKTVKNIFLMKSLKNIVLNFSYILIPAAFVSFLLNDPPSYINGILQPSDPAYSLFSLNYWVTVSNSLNYWLKVMFFLVSPLFTFAWFISIIFLLRSKGYLKRLLLLWQIFTFGLLIFHSPGVSGEYGLYPVIPAAAISVSHLLLKLPYASKIVIVLIILTMPFTFVFGLYLKPLPYYKKTYEFNRTITDNYFQSVINIANDLTPQNGKLFLLPQTKYPIFSLRPDISWSYSGSLENFDVAIVSSPEILGEGANEFYLIKKFVGYEDGEVLQRYVFVKSL